MSMIEVKNLTYAYSDEGNAVEDVSFEIEEGSYTTIINRI